MRTERVALYARVSTLLAQSPAMQLADLQDYAARRGWEVIGEYVEASTACRSSSRWATSL